MTIFFTADHHFGHKNIIKFCNRPFSSVEEMDRVLIDNWNSVVCDKDIVYHLGDFTLGNADEFLHYTSQLNGRIRIVPGGHDRRWLRHKKSRLAQSYSGYQVMLLDPLVSVPIYCRGRPSIAVLCHYAMRVWDRSHYGTWHLYGHSHGNLSGEGLSFDVGVDATMYYPISLSGVAERIKKQV